MATKIQLRRGTAAQWTATNPVLAQGEVGVELATGKWKVGDGATAWNSLAYAGLQLAGDLGGTAAAPTVTGLHLSSPMSQANGGTGAATLGDATFTPTGEGSPRALDDVAASTERVLDVVAEDPEEEHVPREVEDGSVEEHGGEEPDDAEPERPRADLARVEEARRDEPERPHERFAAAPREELEDEDDDAGGDEGAVDERDGASRDRVAQGDQGPGMIRGARGAVLPEARGKRNAPGRPRGAAEVAPPRGGTARPLASMSGRTTSSSC